MNEDRVPTTFEAPPDAAGANPSRERRRAEVALQESEERFRILFEQAPDAIYLIDLEGRFVDGNPAAERLVGYPKSELIGKTFFSIDLLSGAELRKAAASFSRSRLGEPTGPEEFTIQRSDRNLISVEIRTYPILIQERPLVLGIARDVSERKQAEQHLRKLASAVHQSPASIIITDRTGRIEFVNPKFTQITGYSPEEVLGKNPRILKSGETPPEQYRHLWETIAAGKEWHAQLHNRKKDGTLYWQACSISPVRDAAGAITHFVAIQEDTTEKRITEAKLLRAQRVESIGSLASGIAHDLNNILAPIVMCAPLLRQEESPEGLRQLADTIEGSAQRAVAVVKQLLSFARGKEGQKQSVQVRHLVRDMVKLARETFPRSIQVDDHCSKGLWPIPADPTQIHQVLLNLCLNARDAMPSGGRLVLSAENLVLDEHFVGMTPEASPGPHIRLEVRDTGTGILESHQPHIFASFFTTKGEDQGTGLGLTTVQGIIKDHKGIISFVTEVGKGTRFIIHLPALPEVADEVTATEVEGTVRRGHGELVLVVDDEAEICSTIRRTLERHGYSVIVAQDGIKGLAQFSAHQQKIRIVVTDFMMPLMDGVTLSRALRALSPETPIVVSSGGLFGRPGAAALQAFEELGIRHILVKPHTAEVLLTALADALASP
jgi:two-component system, cell cycle sensor histidine kinase and response regulator CckA